MMPILKKTKPEGYSNVLLENKYTRGLRTEIEIDEKTFQGLRFNPEYPIVTRSTRCSLSGRMRYYKKIKENCKKQFCL